MKQAIKHHPPFRFWQTSHNTKLIAHFHNNTRWHVFLIVWKSSNPHLHDSSFIIPNFQPPCLVSHSIMDIFSHPTQIQSKRLCEWRLPVAFPAYHLLDSIESSSPGVFGDVRPVSHVALVYAAHPNSVIQEVRLLAWIATNKLDSHEMVGDGRISSFNGKCYTTWGMSVTPRKWS